MSTVDPNTRFKFSLAQSCAILSAVIYATWLLSNQLRDLRDDNRELKAQLSRVWTDEQHDIFVYIANQQGAKLPYSTEVRRSMK